MGSCQFARAYQIARRYYFTKTLLHEGLELQKEKLQKGSLLHENTFFRVQYFARRHFSMVELFLIIFY